MGYDTHTEGRSMNKAGTKTKSGRVMEKAGMKQEGILRAAGRNNLGICDEVWRAMIRSDRQKQ